jgi:hypothetical protein
VENIGRKGQYILLVRCVASSLHRLVIPNPSEGGHKLVILNVTEGGVKDLLYLPFHIGAKAPLSQ